MTLLAASDDTGEAVAFLLLYPALPRSLALPCAQGLDSVHSTVALHGNYLK